MINIKIDIDPSNILKRQLTELEKTQIPFATMQAVNSVAAQIHYQWRDVSNKVFQNPVQFTRTAALYKKASKQNPSATIFIRDEAPRGVSPAKYLQAQVFGGDRKTKGIERLLGARGFLPTGWFVVPGKGAKLDAHGNIPRSQINAIKSQLRINNDVYTDESAESKARRTKRETKKDTRRGDYFAVTKPRGGLKPGVYQRVKTGFGRATQSILFFVNRTRYKKRFDIFKMAETINKRRMPEIFKAELEKAVQSTWNRAFK